MLTDEEITALAERGLVNYMHVDACKEAIREAVRLCAERCAEICDGLGPVEYPITGTLYRGNCAAAIRERINDQPKTYFNPNEGFGPI